MEIYIYNTKCFSRKKFDKEITCFFIYDSFKINILKILIYNCFNTLNTPGIIIDSKNTKSFLTVNFIFIYKNNKYLDQNFIIFLHWKPDHL